MFVVYGFMVFKGSVVFMRYLIVRSDDLNDIIDFEVKVNQASVFSHIEWLTQIIPLCVEFLQREGKVEFGSIFSLQKGLIFSVEI